MFCDNGIWGKNGLFDWSSGIKNIIWVGMILLRFV